ncbi:hypothetical protein [Mariprofundus sp. KV]|uniref:hypothetical protein n=1 Tax=Mariprofundus sp. KV TaxID=2608715 RepID=UPI0015A1A566|nr:hypothetical protein [Mariprofundus sp. KV]NWF36181.1 hypothetical protein [Mariprofundus sp. KV]
MSNRAVIKRFKCLAIATCLLAIAVCLITNGNAVAEEVAEHPFDVSDLVESCNSIRAYLVTSVKREDVGKEVPDLTQLIRKGCLAPLQQPKKYFNDPDSFFESTFPGASSEPLTDLTSLSPEERVNNRYMFEYIHKSGIIRGRDIPIYYTTTISETYKHWNGTERVSEFRPNLARSTMMVIAFEYFVGPEFRKRHREWRESQLQQLQVYE